LPVRPCRCIPAIVEKYTRASPHGLAAVAAIFVRAQLRRTSLDATPRRRDAAMRRSRVAKCLSQSITPAHGVFWIMTQIDDRAQNATITRLNDTL
jgi:hypothetical protein